MHLRGSSIRLRDSYLLRRRPDRSLAGITLISRAIGFDRDAETLYSSDCSSATYHAQHNSHPVALAVEVCPPRQAASIAVSGHDDSDTYALFLEADARLFGAC